MCQSSVTEEERLKKSLGSDRSCFCRPWLGVDEGRISEMNRKGSEETEKTQGGAGEQRWKMKGFFFSISLSFFIWALPVAVR